MLVQMGVYGNLSLESAIYLEFVEGGAGDANHQKLLNSIDWLKKNDLKTGAKSFWLFFSIIFLFCCRAIFFKDINRIYVRWWLGSDCVTEVECNPS